MSYFKKYYSKKKKNAVSLPENKPKYSSVERKIFHALKDKFKEYDYHIEVICYEELNKCEITCTKNSYDEDDKQLICFDLMLSIYQATGSKVINVGSNSFKEGCHTCGYGSETKVTILINEIDFPKLKQE